MKYIITGPRGRIFRVVEEEPTTTELYYEISNAKASTVENSDVPMFYDVDTNNVITQKQFFKKQRVKRQVERFGIDEAKEFLKNQAAQKRYEKEVSGFELNGINVDTDRNSQAKLTAAYVKAVNDNTVTINWKTNNGFVTLDASTIIAIGDALFDFVQGCFTEEKELIEQIDAATTADDLIQIDL